MRAFTPDVEREAGWRAAHAIATVIAKKTVESDRKLSRLDPLGKIAAANSLADRMAPELAEEAEAAVLAVRLTLEAGDAEAA